MQPNGTPFLDIHTHSSAQHTDIFRLYNVILGFDTMVEVPCSVGIHPCYIQADIASQLLLLERYAPQPHVLAIGECGLDKRSGTTWPTQLDIFKRQLDIAQQVAKPLLIHSVRSYQEILQLIRSCIVPVIFHGFNKNLALGRQLLDTGHFLSFGHAILSGKLDDLIKEIPLQRFFLETDDKSIDIVDIYTYFCSVRKISMAQLKNQLLENVEYIFKYKLQ